MPSRYEGTPQENRALNAYIKLWRAAHLVEVLANADLADHNLTLSQFGVLEALFHIGPLSQRELARKILRSSGNLTLVIENLERDGLVTRQRDPEDRRVMVVTLTPLGEERVRGILPGHVRGIQEIFDVLEEDEIEQLESLTRKLGRTLQERMGKHKR